MGDFLNNNSSARRASRILIVEDDGLLRQMLCRMLGGQDWETIEAGNGEMALEELAVKTPDLIVLDLMMPVMDGFDFAERMRQNPAYRDIPILVLTAMILDETERSRLAPHVQGIIEKGGSPNYMYNLLNQARQYLS